MITEHEYREIVQEYGINSKEYFAALEQALNSWIAYVYIVSNWPDEASTLQYLKDKGQIKKVNKITLNLNKE